MSLNKFRLIIKSDNKENVKINQAKTQIGSDQRNTERDNKVFKHHNLIVCICSTTPQLSRCRVMYQFFAKYSTNETFHQ